MKQGWGLACDVSCRVACVVVIVVVVLFVFVLGTAVQVGDTDHREQLSGDAARHVRLALQRRHHDGVEGGQLFSPCVFLSWCLCV